MADNSTASAFAAQWQNPTGFMSLLMIIGGPIIQTTLAQVTGSRFVPVSFSFGWVSYAFSTISAIVGDGRLMPAADYACKVINLENGYTRTNRSWIIGRVLRDLERPLSEEAMCIAVYEHDSGDKDEDKNRAGPKNNTRTLSGGKSMWFGIACIACQLVIAAIPFKDGKWGIFMITALGTVTAMLTAALPQWRVEKLACRENSKKIIALTVGNGSRQIVVIKGNGKALDLEDLAAGESPRHGRLWVPSGWFVKVTDKSGRNQKIDRLEAYKYYMKECGYSTLSPKFLAGRWIGIRHFPWKKDGIRVPRGEVGEEEIINAYLEKQDWKKEAQLIRRNLPVAFWMTRICCLVFILLWTVVLFSVLALKSNAWYLIAVGTIGMIQNAIVAAASRAPETRGIYLKKEPTIFMGTKVMDVLMELEKTNKGCGKALLKEFFPAGLDVPENRGEDDWWEDRDKSKYDNTRYLAKNTGKRYDSEESEVYGGPNGERKPTRGRKGAITMLP